MADCGDLAACQLADMAEVLEPGLGVTCLPLNGEHRQTLDLLTSWMQDVGLPCISTRQAPRSDDWKVQ